MVSQNRDLTIEVITVKTTSSEIRELLISLSRELLNHLNLFTLKESLKEIHVDIKNRGFTQLHICRRALSPLNLLQNSLLFLVLIVLRTHESPKSGTPRFDPTVLEYLLSKVL